MKKRKILVVTGARSEYGLLYPIIKEIKKSPKFKLEILATGIHLSKKFGYTINEIKKEFKVNYKVKMLLESNSNVAMLQSLGKGIIGLGKALKKANPDLILILGDRGEAFAAAISGYHLNTPIVHLHGGEKTSSGHVDEPVRFSISKFAHVHLVATKKSAELLKRLGEEPWRIHVIGAPGLDDIHEKRFLSKEKIAKKFNLDLKKPVIVVLQHPTSVESKNAAKQMKITMDSILKLKQQTIIIYPNSDAGGLSIIKTIKKYSGNPRNPFIKAYKSLLREEFIGLLNAASVLVGNSSSGIIEAPSLNLPVVNIGERNVGREHTSNIIFAPHNKNKITRAINKALTNKKFKKTIKNSKNPYGNGNSSKKTIKILSKIKINSKLLKKQVCAKGD